MTGALTLGLAAKLKGTIAHDLVPDAPEERLVFDHPSGLTEAFVSVESKDGITKVKRLSILRTARKIMDGRVFLSRGGS